MKMVKSLLLGTAAGVVALTGAQAADLPVKASPVQYVKICSLYGAGFYYIPGTDTCLKIGGWMRFEVGAFANGSFSQGPLRADTNNRLTNNDVWRVRGYITADAREQTAFGTVRAYLAVGVSGNDVDGTGNVFDANRAFIQWAGFTFGQAQSFYDFYSSPATAYFGFYPASDTGDPGWKVMAYTAQFGGGWSATISGEMRRMTQIIGAPAPGVSGGPLGEATSGGSLVAGAALGTAAGGAGDYGGFQFPDVVGNLRVDQTWGSAQIMGALHQLNAQYYGPAALGEGAGNPSDKVGWAVGAGLKLNAPMFGRGDYFQGQVNYTQGATRYEFFTPNYNLFMRKGGNGAFGILTDSVFGGTIAAGTATGQNLTTSWGFNAAYEHFWNDAWRTSLYGGYGAVSYNQQANAILCVLELGGAGVGNTAVAAPGCNNNFSTWFIGTRTQWNVTKNFYLGVDVLYQKLHSAQFAPAVGGNLISGLAGLPVLNTADVDNVAVRFRVHRDFYP